MEKTKILSDTLAVLEAAEELPVPVEDNNDGLKTPTSAMNKIQPNFTCPPAPRKPKAVPLGKRKGTYRELRLLDLSGHVLSLYPPAMLADFGNRMKKARRDQQQNKENIFSNLNPASSE